MDKLKTHKYHLRRATARAVYSQRRTQVLHPLLKNYAAFIIATIFVVITACVKSAHLNVNTLALSDVAGAPAAPQNPKHLTLTDSSIRHEGEREEEGQIGKPGMLPTTSNSLSSSLSLSELEQIPLTVLELQELPRQKQSELEPQHHHIQPQHIPLVDTATATRNALNTAATEDDSNTLLVAPTNLLQQERDDEREEYLTLQNIQSSIKQQDEEQQQQQELEQSRPHSGHHYRQHHHHHHQNLHQQPQQEDHYGSQEHKHNPHHNHHHHQQQQQLQLDKQHLYHHYQPQSLSQPETDTINGGVEGADRNHPSTMAKDEISIITEHYELQPKQNYGKGKISNQASLLNGHSHRSRYSIEDLLHTKFEKKLSNDIYMDPCKAGKSF